MIAMSGEPPERPSSADRTTLNTRASMRPFEGKTSPSTTSGLSSSRLNIMRSPWLFTCSETSRGEPLRSSSTFQ
jgi:hypothetical protein